MTIDFLANIALRQYDVTMANISEVEIKVRPSIPDNVYNWQVFEDDDDLVKFLQCIDKYDAQEIDFNAFVENVDGKDMVFGKEVVQLKTNKIPRGLVALERVFDGSDAPTKTLIVEKDNLEEINLGTEHSPIKVYIGKKISPRVRDMLIALLRKYRHVFSWSYEDLSTLR